MLEMLYFRLFAARNCAGSLYPTSMLLQVSFEISGGRSASKSTGRNGSVVARTRIGRGRSACFASRNRSAETISFSGSGNGSG